jgi:hypothetical protein
MWCALTAFPNGAALVVDEVTLQHAAIAEV